MQAGWNSILRARTGVLGNPLNKLVPSWPGRIRVSDFGSSIQPLTNSAGLIPSRNSNGQKGDDNHWGTTSVPLALVFSACLITLGIK